MNFLVLGRERNCFYIFFPFLLSYCTCDTKSNDECALMCRLIVYYFCCVVVGMVLVVDLDLVGLTGASS
jgi:hypothetical protein